MNSGTGIDSKYLVVKGRAGLGNRLFVLAHAIVQAQITGRTLVVDWRDRTYSDGAINVFDLFVSVNGRYCQTPPEKLSHRNVFPTAWQGHLHLSVVDYVASLRKQYGKLGKHRVENLVGINRGMMEFSHEPDIVAAWGYGQHLNAIPSGDKLREFGTDVTTALLKIVFHERIRFQDSVRVGAERYLSQTCGATELVGIHVRDGDKPLEKPLEVCFSRIDALLDTAVNAVFLATDSTRVLQAFKARYGTKLLYFEKWLPPVGQAAHQNPNCPDRIQNGIAALTDLYILSQCAHLLYQHTSTFSQVAKYLANAPKGTKRSWLE